MQDAHKVLLQHMGTLPDLAEGQLLLCTEATPCQTAVNNPQASFLPRALLGRSLHRILYMLHDSECRMCAKSPQANSHHH